MERDALLRTFCQNLIQCPSLSGEEKQVAQLIVQTMKEQGFDEMIIDRYGSVVGTIRGKFPGKALLLDGHIDTVPITDQAQWKHDPYGAKIENNRMYGRGTSDMKASVASMILAAAFFAQDTHKEFSGSVSVSCTVHEECFEGVSSREVSQRVHPDYVIIGEATTNTLKRGQRGRAEIVVETIGKSCHSSNPQEGFNAVYPMLSIVEKIQQLKKEHHPVLGEGILELTDIKSSPYPGSSVVPDFCKVTYDRRLLVGETEESVLAPIERILQEVRQEYPTLIAQAYLAQGEALCWTGETIKAKRFFPAWIVQEDDELVTKALTGLQKAGIEPKLSHFSFCTNGSHFCGEAHIPTIGFGPSREELAHVIDEYIELDQLYASCRGFTAIIAELLQ